MASMQSNLATRITMMCVKQYLKRRNNRLFFGLKHTVTFIYHVYGLAFYIYIYIYVDYGTGIILRHKL